MRQRVVIGALLITVFTALPARAEIKLAYVDVQRALNECRAGRAGREKIKREVEQVEAKLGRQQSEVEALKNEIEKKGALMNDQDRQNLEEEYSRKLRNFQEDYKNSQDELRQRDSQITGAIVRDLAQVVRGIGEKRGYTLVLEKGGLLWGTPGIDITDEVIRAYDAMNVKAGSLAAPRVGSSSGGQFARPRGGSSSPVHINPSEQSEGAGRSTLLK